MVALTDACINLPTILCIQSDNYTCDNEGGKMTSPTLWIGIAGFLLMGILLAYK